MIKLNVLDQESSRADGGKYSNDVPVIYELRSDIKRLEDASKDELDTFIASCQSQPDDKASRTADDRQMLVTDHLQNRSKKLVQYFMDIEQELKITREKLDEFRGAVEARCDGITGMWCNVGVQYGTGRWCNVGVQHRHNKDRPAILLAEC